MLTQVWTTRRCLNIAPYRSDGVSGCSENVSKNSDNRHVITAGSDRLTRRVTIAQNSIFNLVELCTTISNSVESPDRANSTLHGCSTETTDVTHRSGPSCFLSTSSEIPRRPILTEARKKRTNYHSHYVALTESSPAQVHFWEDN